MGIPYELWDSYIEASGIEDYLRDNRIPYHTRAAEKLVQIGPNIRGVKRKTFFVFKVDLEDEDRVAISLKFPDLKIEKV